MTTPSKSSGRRNGAGKQTKSPKMKRTATRCRPKRPRRNFLLFQIAIRIPQADFHDCLTKIGITNLNIIHHPRIKRSNAIIRRPRRIGVSEYPCVTHISYLILTLTFSQSLTLTSCILFLGGSLRGGLSSPPPDSP